MGKAELGLGVVRATFHVLDPRQDRRELAHRLAVLAFVGGVHDHRVVSWKNVRGPRQPATNSPRKVVGGLVVASTHDLETARIASLQMQEPREVAAGLLDGDDVGMISDRVEAVEADLDTGTCRIVVEDDGPIDRIGDHPVVGGELALGR